MSIGDEAMRRAMVDDGLDPTDPEQRRIYAQTVTGSLTKMSAELDRIGRLLSIPAQWLIRQICRIREGSNE